MGFTPFSFPESPMRILIVDDEKIKRITLADDLSAAGHEVVTAADGEEAWTQLQTAQLDVVVSDLKMPRLDGIDLLKRIKQGRMAEMAVIMMTAYGSIPVAVEAMHWGPSTSSPSPSATKTSSRSWPGWTAAARPQDEAAAPTGEAGPLNLEQIVVSRSPGMVRVRQMIEVCARTEAKCSCWARRACGKDLISRRSTTFPTAASIPYVKVGCTLFPENLIESELYGHEKGSFTGAERRHKATSKWPKKARLYLDDVDDIPLEQQSKLLRAIEEKVYERVGGTTPIKADVRIIASTKRNLLEKIGEGTFRQDLYSGSTCCGSWCPRCASGSRTCRCWPSTCFGRLPVTAPARSSRGRWSLLSRHDWPGNVRELTHALERACLIGGGQITRGGVGERNGGH